LPNPTIIGAEGGKGLMGYFSNKGPVSAYGRREIPSVIYLPKEESEERPSLRMDNVYSRPFVHTDEFGGFNLNVIGDQVNPPSLEDFRDLVDGEGKMIIPFDRVTSRRVISKREFPRFFEMMQKMINRAFE
jgi:hypothetical protein